MQWSISGWGHKSRQQADVRFGGIIVDSVDRVAFLVCYYFMPPQAEAITFSLSRCSDVCPVRTSAFLSLRMNTKRISIKFGAGDHCHHEWWTDYIFGDQEQDTTENSNRRQTDASRSDYLHSTPLQLEQHISQIQSIKLL